MVACGSPPGHVGRPEVSRSDTFAITDAPTLIVEDFNGSVKVYGGEHDQQINVVAELRRPDRVEYEAVQNGEYGQRYGTGDWPLGQSLPDGTAG